MRNIKLVLEYDGTNLCGWQRQKNGPTVQMHVEEALSTLLKKETTIAGASRTDAGVHAQGQVATFQTDHPIPPRGIRSALNGLLPSQIAVREAEEVAPDFHARFSSVGKHYRYNLYVAHERSPRLARFAWHRKKEMDIEAMNQAAALFVGDHDFSAFRASGCSAQSTIRRIHRAYIEEETWKKTSPPLLVFHIWGNAFLRNMVRIITGTLVAVGDKKTEPSEINRIIESRNRCQAGKTAPPHGLCLEEVIY